MKKSVQFAGILAAALTVTSLFSLSANAETRHQDESSSWREAQRNDRDGRHDRDGRYGRDSRRDDRDFLTGYVERLDRRRGIAVLRTRNNSRPVVVEMIRERNGRGIDFGDLRRGDRVTFVGDWDRNGGFTAWRIEDVDSRGGRGRGRW